MKGLPEERTIRLAQYMVEERATVRQTAARFGISKSTVHKDITTRLKKQNAVLYERVQEVLRTNKQERHIRGGMATREKYRAKAAESQSASRQ
ncbi:sporulation transcriptional regulator SpoIIID [Agathobaculum desmolans]|uniref:sporulation transcriptional regulator SpoIIID n=1 Tax=Agathobaculum desmolans TaxID=39484 RepID=UPI0004E20164|nr:sporulation transcriptional regulator SpoIIID [Agathobaculum desmolans]